nr:MAG TPA: hypothetical protein [Caudoviricetes sp.]
MPFNFNLFIFIFAINSFALKAKPYALFFIDLF